LTVEVSEDLDNYFKNEHAQYQNFSSLFCCLGSQRKHGKETFVKVDKTYPILAANIALKNSNLAMIIEIPHYLLVSSMGSDSKSWFLYPKTKGEVEDELKQKKLNLLTIFRPGLLKNRRDVRAV
jgi:oxidoreductase